MRKFALAALVGAASLGLAACGDSGSNNASNGAAGDGNGAATGGEAGGDGTGTGNGSAGGATAGGNWPAGTRIVEENGVTFRVNPDGTRVQLGSTDARIVVENGVRYRVDPGGARVRINEQGIDIDGPNIDLPDVDVGINNKGNLDVDVGDRDPDGGR